jgi:hypothetical protein
MNSFFIPLQVTPGIEGLFLKPLCGMNELSVEDIGTRTALTLLESLLSKDNSKHSANNINVSKISTADRDRILAHVYISVYGPKIESTSNCENCNIPYDLDFSMADLLNHYPLEPKLLLDDGTFQTESGSSFRLPTGEDELLLAALSPPDAEDFLMTRCLVKGEPNNDNVSIQRKMSEIAPVLNIEMQANCPECGQVQQVQFDVQSFLLTKIMQERSQLIREIHSIAVNYHWAQETILQIPRHLRKQYVSYIESER